MTVFEWDGLTILEKIVEATECMPEEWSKVVEARSMALVVRLRRPDGMEMTVALPYAEMRDLQSPMPFVDKVWAAARTLAETPHASVLAMSAGPP